MAYLHKLGRVASNLKMGIVGMANVGKSSTFNMLSKLTVPAENYPFCTIDPNHAVVRVPDPRFDYLCQQFKPKSEIHTTLSITDIAGLVKGASEGYGLGNEFLSHIQQVDGLYQVVRAFEQDKILHTEGTMDPVRDLQIISDELVARDLQLVEKKLEEFSRKLKKYETTKHVSLEAKDMLTTHKVLQKSETILKNKKWVRFTPWTDVECESLNKLQLLTAKPSIYLINLSQADYNKTLAKQELKCSKGITDWISKNGGDSQIIYYSVEGDDMQNKLDQIINSGYSLLGLVRFFTVGVDEVRSWNIKKNLKAPQASSVIHTDFEKGFISCEVLPYDKFKSLGNSAIDLYQKKFTREGKEYIVKDGDIVHFKCKMVK